jgi:hypothetical protein
MGHDREQISLLARILIVKHGQSAPAVAAERVRLWTEAADAITADLWRAVDDAVVLRLVQPRQEPTLADVLDGTVTRLTMDADGVSREDVEAVMSAARKKRQRTARRSRRTFRRASRHT